tara:strand:+ start:173 stop:586 length:414 start_codon:yes stop_codon:yes gene_type:complete
MFIECVKCNKKFVVEDNQIPLNGRLLQCGSCQYEWFFKPDKNNTNQEILLKIDNEEDSKTEKQKNTEVHLNQKIEKDNYKKLLNNLLIIIITFIAIIIVIDTFKESLSLLLPGLTPLLNNFYSILYDLQLFVKDLFN